MKTTYKVLTTLITAGIILGTAEVTLAGNGDRVGQAGATELLINPWARSTGWAGANAAGARGLEAMYMNVAGTAFTKRTELMFCHTNWLGGTGIGINAFGFTQRVGETGAIGLGVMSMDFGDIQITTVDLPEGGVGTFHPTYTNIGLSYAKGFSENIYGGIVIKAISESIADVAARGVCLDAGIQYVTGKYDQVHFGISLRNVGPRMRFSGDGLSFRGTSPSGNYAMTLEQRTADFDMPTLVNISGSYDFYFAKDSTSMKNHRVTVAGTFTSNSYSKDEFRVGVEYAWRSMLMIRGGYCYEEGITKMDTRTTCFTGANAGVSVELPFGKKGSTFAIDYSYRATNPFNGVHSFGARLNL
ncbi:MAG TPA: PorV/PorQ family protein [Bacteroidia bacterium]|nr:PorV/PorQ family protein [Bacteroidia bacterium]